jgi:hypothetical protein
MKCNIKIEVNFTEINVLFPSDINQLILSILPN